MKDQVTNNRNDKGRKRERKKWEKTKSQFENERKEKKIKWEVKNLF